MGSNVAHEFRISTMTSPTHQGAAAAQGKEAGTPHSAWWQLPQDQFSAAKNPPGSVSAHQLAQKNTRGSNKIPPWYLQTGCLLNNTSFTSSGEILVKYAKA